MKNIQVIDGADNCTYSIYAVTDAEFSLLFPGQSQNIEFIEDFIARMGEARAGEVMKEIWKRFTKKADAVGIHGTVFFGLTQKKRYYPTKNDEEMIVSL